jgi:hypothetical protein
MKTLKPTTTMEVLVFKTNLQQADDVERVTITMNEEQRILKWTVDREDCDKVLRVESDHIPADEVAALIRQAGYSCEELTY